MRAGFPPEHVPCRKPRSYDNQILIRIGAVNMFRTHDIGTPLHDLLVIARADLRERLLLGIICEPHDVQAD
jgi:diphthamide biosynthesis methyltransferase